MPIYEYQCDQCGNIQEILQKINEEPLTGCTHCSGKLHKLISQSAFHLKGTGWYVTDYAGKSLKKSDSNDSPTASKDTKTSETPKTTDTGASSEA
ncbi:MAG: zinc ribbon domain-containing protein [Desulfatitalea sp.]|nr:zinc ribbon domain-containing protein [Desulfatitalea sp.]